MEDIIISVYDRSLRTYNIFKYHIWEPGEIGGLLIGDTVESLNERYELAIDGEPVIFPSSDPHLIEHYIHQMVSDIVNEDRVSVDDK